jgi:hypothetical protein
MTDARELLAGLLDVGDVPAVSAEEMIGRLGPHVREWQRLGFLAREPSANPVPSCPHCDDGVPYGLGDRLLCDRCLSPVDPAALHLWAFDRAAFFGWLAGALALHGETHPVGPLLWQLGTAILQGEVCEVFYRRPGPLTDAERQRLRAYRQACVLFGRTTPPEGECDGESRSLLELLHDTLPLAVRPLVGRSSSDGDVRFDADTGALWAGTRRLGEVPLGSKEHALLGRLAAEPDRFVPYRDLKRAVLRETGSSDTADEATFCHKLKSRIKRRFIPEIDRVLVTSNKGDGYRLRATLAPALLVPET